MGDALRDRLSDRGSIPLRSIYGTSRKDSIYAAFRGLFFIRDYFADTESVGDRMGKMPNSKKNTEKNQIITITVWLLLLYFLYVLV